MANADIDKAPSEMFLDSMQEGGVGSEELICDWCGRLHLCPDYESEYMDEGEQELHKAECERQYKENPDKVVLHYDADCIIGRNLNSKLFVIGCPCNGLTRYEIFIWEHRNTIRNYLSTRIRQEHEWAEQELTRNKLAGIK